MQRPKLPTQPFDSGYVQKTERHTAFAALHGMMKPMCLVQALEVTFARDHFERPAPVDQAVVGNEIQDTVGRHACAYPLQRVPAGIAQGDENDRQHGEHRGVEIVLLEDPGAWLMVRAVPAPAEAVHDVLVSKPGHAFHGGQGAEKGE